MKLGTVTLGSDRVRQVRVENSGTVPLEIGSITITNITGVAFSRANECAGATVDPGRSCRIEVTFEPPAAGFFQADLRVDYLNSSGGDSRIPLQGTGVL